MWCLCWVLGTCNLRVLRLHIGEVCCKRTHHFPSECVLRWSAVPSLHARGTTSAFFQWFFFCSSPFSKTNCVIVAFLGPQMLVLLGIFQFSFFWDSVWWCPFLWFPVGHHTQLCEFLFSSYKNQWQTQETQNEQEPPNEILKIDLCDSWTKTVCVSVAPSLLFLVLSVNPAKTNNADEGFCSALTLIELSTFIGGVCIVRPS